MKLGIKKMFSKTNKNILAMTLLMLFINFTFSTSVKAYAASWKSVKDAGFSTSAAYYTSIATAGDGTPYVAYQDSENGNKVTVKKYDGTNWVTVGDADVSESTANYVSIAVDINGEPYVAYVDGQNNNGVTVKKYNGSNWATVGDAGFSESHAYYTSIAIDKEGSPYVIYKDDANNNKATVKKYNGSNWITVGDKGFSEGTVNYTSIAIDEEGTPYVIYQDGGNSGKATVKKYDGSDWTTVGDVGFSSNYAYYTSIDIAQDGTPYVAYKDDGNSSKATVKKYDGSSWTTVGNEGLSVSTASFTTIAIGGDGTPYVAYMDGGNNNKATTMRYDGSNWTTVGDAGFSAGTAYYTSIATDKNGTTYVVYMDTGNSNKTTVMKYEAPITTYTVELSQVEIYTFEDQIEGYSSVTPVTITATKTGTGDITNLNAALSGTNADSFTLGALDITTLDATVTSSTFTIQPKDNLPAGIYTATITVTSNENVSKSFDVSFTVNSEILEISEVPSTVEITRDEDTLTAELEKEDGNEFTTSAAVTYDWYRDNELIDGEHSNNYELSDEDEGKDIVVKVEQYNLESDSFYIDADEEKEADEEYVEVEVTTPAAVTIEGNERVGNILEAQLLAEDGTEITAVSDVTYEWYRLSNEESEDGELIREDKTYELVDSDEGKYIKLVVNYYNDILEDISKVVKKLSNSNSNSSSNK